MSFLKSLTEKRGGAALLAALVFCMLLALAGCSGGGDDSGAPEGGESVTFAAECTDADNHPTAYAMMELEGQQLVTMLEESGFTYEGSVWMNAEGNCSVVVGDANGAFDDDQVAALDKGGAGAPVTYVITMDGGYDSVEAALFGLTPMSLEDSYVVDETVAAGVAYGPSMTECLVVATSGEDNGFSVIVFNQEAVAEGLAMDVLGAEGTTIDELWVNLTGHDPSDHE